MQQIGSILLNTFPCYNENNLDNVRIILLFNDDAHDGDDAHDDDDDRDGGGDHGDGGAHDGDHGGDDHRDGGHDGDDVHGDHDDDDDAWLLCHSDKHQPFCKERQY